MSDLKLTRISTMQDGRPIYAVNQPSIDSCAEVIMRLLNKRRLDEAKAKAEQEAQDTQN